MGIPATGPVDLPTMYQFMSTLPWVRDLEWGRGTVAGLLADLQVFAVARGRLVAVGDGAAALRDSVAGARAIERVEALLASHPGKTVTGVGFVDATHGGHRRRSRLRAQQALESAGLLRAFGRLADALGGVQPAARRRMVADLVRGSADVRAAMAMAMAASVDAGTMASVTDTNAVVLSPTVTNLLTSPAGSAPRTSTRFVTEVLLHELEHTVSPTPASVGSAAGLGWLEEGTAEVLARWPGVAERAATALGLAAPPAAAALDADDPYDGYTLIVRGLVRLAGVDLDDPVAVDQARRLLQGVDLTRTSGMLARAIARTHGIASERVPDLARRIARLDGSPEALRRLERLVRTVGSPPAPSS